MQGSLQFSRESGGMSFLEVKVGVFLTIFGSARLTVYVKGRSLVFGLGL
jgi:hypothetical protein